MGCVLNANPLEMQKVGIIRQGYLVPPYSNIQLLRVPVIWIGPFLFYVPTRDLYERLADLCTRLVVLILLAVLIGTLLSEYDFSNFHLFVFHC
jgi:hypothetical protein